MRIRHELTLLLLVALLRAAPTLAAGALEPIADSLATVGYVPAYPSKLGSEWGPWQKGVDDLIALIAGDVKHKPSAEDIEYEAKRAGLEDVLVFAMIEELSRFDSYHESSPRNQGLLQLDPVLNAKYARKENTLFQPKYNLRLGCSLLRYYIDRNRGNISTAVLQFLSEASPQREPAAVAERIFMRRKARFAQLQKNRPITPPAAK